MRRSMNTVFEESNDGALDSTGSSGNLLDRDTSSLRLTKRYQIFQELMETEQNYVEVLKCILTNYKSELENLDENECNKILSNHEMHVLFSRIKHILETHERILKVLEREDSDWTGKNLIGYAIAHQKEHLIKNYVPYMNSYDEILEILKRIESNPTADQFIRSCDSKSTKKYMFKDLLIRPIQRLPSVEILLKELLKATPKNNPDYKCIELAREVIIDVLSKSNENRRANDNHHQTLETINSIENFPNDYVQSNRSFYCQADFQILHSEMPTYKRYRRSIITLFLFNDIVFMAKRRDYVQPAYKSGNHGRLSINSSMTSLNSSINDLPRTLSRSSSISTLKRSLSFISNSVKNERKPFKFIEALSFNSFRDFMYIRQDGLFYVKMRDSMDEGQVTLRIASDTTVELATNFMHSLCDLINSTSKREVFLRDISDLFYGENTLNMCGTPCDDLEYVRKTRQKAID
ncbi:Protein ECT2 [Aphelenchoides bicaudatus]|nr:Protein ECT2 [Aphelenchoides bicaudatus]